MYTLLLFTICDLQQKAFISSYNLSPSLKEVRERAPAGQEMKQKPWGNAAYGLLPGLLSDSLVTQHRLTCPGWRCTQWACVLSKQLPTKLHSQSQTLFPLVFSISVDIEPKNREGGMTGK